MANSLFAIVENMYCRKLAVIKHENILIKYSEVKHAAIWDTFDMRWQVEGSYFGRSKCLHLMLV